MEAVIRPVRDGDAAEIAAIYAPYVLNTAISFEATPPPLVEMAARIRDIVAGYPYLVAERDGCVVGYAYATLLRTRAAYQEAVEVTVYLAPAAQRQGFGRALYARLLPLLAERGFHAAFAGIALPNEPSIALHEAAGFEPAGVWREVGLKFGRWIDVGWWQRRL